MLLNPQLNYKNRHIDQKPYWSNDYLDDGFTRALNEQGYISHRPGLKHGKALLDEVFWLQPHAALAEITAPTLMGVALLQ